jgi:hypothetical protein
MTLFVAWVVFPLVLATLSLGCGLLVEELGDVQLPRALLTPVGFAVVIVVASLATMNGATARLATPATVALAVAGLTATAPWRGRRADKWALVAAVGVFGAFAAPIVFSGQATFAGYISLDDTATWLAMTDRVMDHGRDLSGLQPSSYEAALDSYLKQSGYPVGSFLPLGVGGKLVGQDIAWLFQPYIAYAAAMLALSLYAIVRRLVGSAWLCALSAFVAAQPALLYGYGMWSGIKELTAAALVALCAALLPSVFFSRSTLERRSARRLLPLAATIAALLDAVSLGGVAWLLGAIVVLAIAAFRLSVRAFAIRAVALTAATAVLSIPAIAIATTFIRHETSTSSLTGANELGNLFHPLSQLQSFGIWPAGDFRGAPTDLDATHILIAVAVLAGAGGLWFAWRRRAWELLLYVGTVAIGAVLLVIKGSPWVDGKAMATASPACLVAGMAASAFVFERGRRVEAAVIAAAIAGGVFWSNVLAYHSVWLAPRSQLVELESIGVRFAGQGPTLLTESQPYGVRHFLRRLDAEGPSELRRRAVPLANGQVLEKGGYADLDQFGLPGILVYKTLVLRRSPAESRPPSVYQLVKGGRYYEVWQRPDNFTAIREHHSLGDALQPGAIPSCSVVLRLAERAGAGGVLTAAPRLPVIAVNLSNATHPAAWPADSAGLLYPQNSGAAQTDVRMPHDARYSIWLGGSFRDRVRLYVDGQMVAETRQHLNEGPQYTRLGTMALKKGSHQVVLRYAGPDVRPGSAGFQFGLGPLVFGRGTDNGSLISVPSANARALCGRSLDWIDVLGS